MSVSSRFVVSALLAVAVAGAGDGCTRAPGDGNALLEADRRFARETAQRGADGWAQTFQESGIMFPPAGRVDGREAIRERMETAFAPGRPKLRWEPMTAVLAASKDLGYTLGRWTRVTTGSNGADSVLGEGNYVTVWSKDAAGVWKVAVDIGNSDPAP